MRAYVINLPATVDQRLSEIRRQHITAQLARAGIDHHLVAAVDGLRLTAEQRKGIVDEEVVAEHPRWLSPGVVGAALSHVQAYREILQAGDEAALVLEDDVVLPDGLDRLLLEVTDQLSANEVVLLYWRTWPGCEFSGRDAVPLSGGQRLMFPMDPGKLSCASAYVVTRAACRTLVEALLPIRTCTDVWGSFHQWGGFQQMRCVVPRAVGMRTDFKSTVGYVSSDSLLGRMTTFVAHHRVFGVYQALGWHRARLERQATRFQVVDRPSPLRAGVAPS